MDECGSPKSPHMTMVVTPICYILNSNSFKT